MRVRLDKYLSEYTELTRTQAKKAIRCGRVRINDTVAEKGEDRVALSDAVFLDGVKISAELYQYIMLNKPAGIISATTDDRDETVVDYIRRHPCQEAGTASEYKENERRPFPAKDLFPMGRLDKDTEGLLILTNDGEMAHRLLSPKNHVPKTYFVRVDHVLQESDVENMLKGLDIGEKRETKPAKMEILSERECLLTITEGKFHQVKRMFGCLGKKVVYLKRVEMAGLKLDDTLETGEWRFLTEDEIAQLK